MTAALVAVSEVLPVARHPVAVYLAGLESPGSRRVQRSALVQLAGRLCPGAEVLRVPWWRLTYGVCVQLFALLAQHYSASSVSRLLSALRGVLRASFLLGLFPAEEWARVQALRAPGGVARGDAEVAGRGLSSEELRKLLQVCDPNTTAGLRDAAVVAVLYGCGLRRAEVASLELGSLDREGWTLRVLGKGRKWRTVPVGSEGARWALSEWLRVRGGGEVSGPLFRRVYKGGVLHPSGLCGRSIAGIVERAASKAGLANVHAHDLRRSYVSDLLDRGADPLLVAGLVGHASLRTTLRYDRRPARARAAAAALLEVPVRRREGL